MDFRRAGGQLVGPGDYWNLHDGTRVRVEREAVLPGEPSTTYLRASPWAMALVIPALGASFAFYLPGIGIAFTLAWLGKLVAPGLVRWSAVQDEAPVAPPEPRLALEGADSAAGGEDAR